MNYPYPASDRFLPDPFDAFCPVCHDTSPSQFCQGFDRIRQLPQEIWSVIRCPKCGFGWTCPPIQVEDIPGFYPPTYLGDTMKTLREFRSGQLIKTRSWRRETEKVALVQRYVAGGRILDVGCADAKFLWALDPQNWQRSGVEFNQEVLSIVRKQVPDLELYAGDIYCDQLPLRSFDVITFWHVFEHLPTPTRVLKRITELLQPGGTVIISVPNLNSLQAGWFGTNWYGLDVPRHLYHFTPQSLARLLVNAGFRIKDEVFFSRLANFHSWKYSVIQWSEALFSSRIPYYLLKPLLFALPPIEQWTRRYGIFTTVAELK